MNPAEIKDKVQNAYLQARSNSVMRSRYSSGLDHLFRDLKLYGRDAGADFVETHLNDIVKEAVETADCRGHSLRLTAYGFGRSAINGLAEALRERTGLTVEVGKSTITLIWAGEDKPSLI